MIITDAFLYRVMQARQDDYAILQNPISFIGAWKRVIPYGRTGQGWWGILTWTVTVLALLVSWVVVLGWYLLLSAFLLLGWIPWAMYTLNRRHHVWDRRRAVIYRPY